MYILQGVLRGRGGNEGSRVGGEGGERETKEGGMVGPQELTEMTPL